MGRIQFRARECCRRRRSCSCVGPSSSEVAGSPDLELLSLLTALPSMLRRCWTADPPLSKRKGIYVRRPPFISRSLMREAIATPKEARPVPLFFLKCANRAYAPAARPHARKPVPSRSALRGPGPAPPNSPPNLTFALLAEYRGLPVTRPAEHAPRRADLEY